MTATTEPTTAPIPIPEPLVKRLKAKNEELQRVRQEFSDLLELTNELVDPPEGSVLRNLDVGFEPPAPADK